MSRGRGTLSKQRTLHGQSPQDTRHWVGGREENVMGSVLEMLMDMSVRYNLSCRQLGVGHAAGEGGLNMGVICMWIVRGDQGE